jgi:copper chaperone NosL
MKKFTLFLLITLVGLFGAAPAFSQEDVTKHPSCKYCGMDRAKFAHSRVFIEYTDGTTEGTCSIHCAAIDLALNIDKTPKNIWVGDCQEKTLVDAEKAVWLLGGNKPGVMTKNAKWAFAKSEQANQFKEANGGELVNFDQAIKATYEDMYADTKMIRDRRMAMKQKMMEHKH